MGQEIKIYVACHKECYVPNHPLLYPVQVGAANEEKRFVDMQYDNEGCNISALNQNYCELTAQYWAWKNENADYYGFFHYRRYLSFKRNNSFPYEILDKPDDNSLQYMGYDPESMTDLISKYDIIVPIPENMYVSVYDHYLWSANHHIEDLRLVYEIIKQCHNEFTDAADEYFNNPKQLFGNIYIMKKELFFAYCKWLFSILEEFDKQTDFSRYSGKDKRVDGYLGERLLGVYYTWLKKQNVSYYELPRVHFESFPGETDNFEQMRRIYRLLPPGTWRRSLAKRFFK